MENQKMQNSVNSTAEVKKKYFIIDTDCGVDDLTAIFLMVTMKIPILAITVVAGNCSLELAVKNVNLGLLTAFGEKHHIEIIPGAKRALIYPHEGATYYHGSDGLGDIPNRSQNVPLINVNTKEHASTRMIQLAKQYPGQISILNLGPLTNLAMAVRLGDSSFVNSIERVYFMGGGKPNYGNITAAAEYNMYADPHAASIVLHAPWLHPVEVVSWSSTVKNPLNLDYLFKMYKIAPNSPICTLIRHAEQNLVEISKKRCDNQYFIPDPLTSLVAINDYFLEANVTRHKATAMVILQGSPTTRGLMLTDMRHGMFEEEEKESFGYMNCGIDEPKSFSDPFKIPKRVNIHYVTKIQKEFIEKCYLKLFSSTQGQHFLFDD